MKKYKWLILIVIIIAVLSIVAILFSDSEDKYLRETSIDNVIKMKDNDESFILYIKQTNCEHCKVFTPRFVSALKENNLKAYVLNIANLSDDEQELYDDTIEIEGTPTVLFYDEGEESLIRIEGEVTKDVIESKLKASGFLK